MKTFEELVDVIDQQDYKMEKEERIRILDKFWGDTKDKESSKEILNKILC